MADPKDPYDRKLILIPAVPSSGTSALAGVLHHLGVNMGAIDGDGSLKKRGYEMYEDTDVWKFCAVMQKDHPFHESVGKLSRTALRLRSYINYRFMNDPPGPIGAKIPAVLCLYDPDVPSLPIITLDVWRLFERCLVSDQKIMMNMGRFEKIKDSWEAVCHFRKLRAGDLGACVEAKMNLFNYHTPIFQIQFDDLVAKSEECVNNLVEKLNNEGIYPTDEQVESAIKFIDPDKKHM